MTIRPLLALLLPIALAMPAAAECCSGLCSEAFRTGTPETAAGQFYVVHDHVCLPDCATPFPSLWVYQETNGIAGLQRGDEVSDETCGGAFASDTIVF